MSCSVYELGLARGSEILAFQFSGSYNSPLAGSSNFIFQAVIQSLGGEKNCILYSLLCIIIIIITIVSISFVTLLNCHYLNPRLFPFIHFSSATCWGGKGGVSEQLFSA